jgi:hypothetical protein
MALRSCSTSTATTPTSSGPGSNTACPSSSPWRRSTRSSSPRRRRPARARRSPGRNLDELLAEVFGAIDVVRPTGELVAVGHSGAYRTLLAWAEHPGLDWIISPRRHLRRGRRLARRGWRRRRRTSPDLRRRRHRALDRGAGPTASPRDLARRAGDRRALSAMRPCPTSSARRAARAGPRHGTCARSATATCRWPPPAGPSRRLLRLAPVEVLADAPWRERRSGLPARDRRRRRSRAVTWLRSRLAPPRGSAPRWCSWPVAPLRRPALQDAVNAITTNDAAARPAPAALPAATGAWAWPPTDADCASC